MEYETVAIRRRWDELWARIGVRRDGAPSIDPLILAYGSERRHYHNLKHVLQCLEEFAAVRPLCANPDAVELAIWYHDVVYDPTRGDNEERSADVAAEALRAAGAEEAMAGRVTALILATKHTAAPADGDGQILVDVDLSVLGRTSDEFDAYEHAIRREYDHVDDDAFRAGRTAVLRRFLERPTIYGTVALREKYEVPARSNLRRSIERLTRGV